MINKITVSLVNVLLIGRESEGLRQIGERVLLRCLAAMVHAPQTVGLAVDGDDLDAHIAALSSSMGIERE